MKKHKANRRVTPPPNLAAKALGDPRFRARAAPNRKIKGEDRPKHKGAERRRILRAGEDDES